MRVSGEGGAGLFSLVDSDGTQGKAVSRLVLGEKLGCLATHQHGGQALEQASQGNLNISKPIGVQETFGQQS